MSRRVVPLVLFLLAVLAAPAGAATSHVVGGVLAAEHPEQAQLSVTKAAGSSSMCGGTLIDPSWVLTAAHCVTDEADGIVAPGAVVVRLGSSRLFAGTEHAVDLVLRSPDWDALALSSDAALVHLAVPSDKAPVTLASPAEIGALAAPGLAARVVGWGQTGVRTAASLVLREADVPIIADAVCGSRSVYGGSFEPATMLCAGGNGADACFGDSGGPLLVDADGSPAVAWRQIGIVSWGEGCGADGFPGVYTDLGEPRLRAWIAGTLAGQTVALPPRGSATGTTTAPAAAQAATPAAQSPPAAGTVALPRSCRRGRCRVAVTFNAAGLAVARLALPRRSLTRGVVTLARTQLVASAAGTHRVTVALSRRVRRALRGRAVRVRVSAELYVPGAPVVTAQRVLRLRTR